VIAFTIALIKIDLFNLVLSPVTLNIYRVNTIVSHDSRFTKASRNNEVPSFPNDAPHHHPKEEVSEADTEQMQENNYEESDSSSTADKKQTEECDGNESDSSHSERRKKKRKQQLCMRDLANKFDVTDDNNNRYKCIYGTECHFRHLPNRQAVGTAIEALGFVKQSFYKDPTLRSKLAKAIRAATDLPK
jgi:hypothetical protein